MGENKICVMLKYNQIGWEIRHFFLEGPAECNDSVGRVRLGIKEMLVRDSLPVKSMCCVFEQDILSAA